ncbi:uncharacterized protein BJ212DRAFT_1417850 [Suillus subaureus]|uniref:DPH-type MB domain-containing protein n=1 Tax=Suillus subaureus TaxID=48587 RepID=A0A9P7DFI9_9AGAM|nr:uncharacterized protein BJ212DRAFT_1417850 [Suillus subaureus]KAG1792110.1 hypothetical protein BJ212DRAFT_1417850 [Suillus subaureus]
MGAYYDEIEIEDMAWDEAKDLSKQLTNCEDIATCPSCSLIIRLDFEDESPDDEGSASQESEEDEEESDNSDDDQFEDALEKLTLTEPIGSVGCSSSIRN